MVRPAFMNFQAVDANFRRRFNAEANFVALHRDHGDTDMAVDHDRFVRAA
jgi:hypothetical protein